MEPDSDLLQQCKYIHEVELVNMKLQMRILETHLETKDRLLRNLEDIIDEQEARIQNMEEFIQGGCVSYVARNQILKGISVLSLDFGTLSEENFRLKQQLADIQRQNRINQLMIDETDEDYESDMTMDERRVSPLPVTEPTKPAYTAIARSMVDEAQLKKLQRFANELKNEKNELRQLATDTKEAFNVCMSEVRLMLESKTADFFRVLICRYKAEMEKRKQLHNQLVELNGNIRVFYRIRPSLPGSLEESALEVDSMDNGVVYLTAASGKKCSKSVDRVIPTHFSQNQIFDEVSPIITSCMDGYNVCIFAYGHTGSGKTYTMEGPSSDPGINQRAIMQLFSTTEEKKGDIEYSISMSMMEIYNEKIRDLLVPSDTNLTIRMGEDGRLSIPGLQAIPVKSNEDVHKLLAEGKKNKAIASTSANPESSRSHVIVRVFVEGRNTITGQISTGRLNLVDLAGSERVSQTNATGQLLKEAQSINKSLSELGNVVLALRQNQKHIPFRNCQLTRILEDSLNGDSKTLVIVHLCPDASQVNESLSSMNFAEKIGNINMKGGTIKRDSISRRSTTSNNSRKSLTADTFTSPKK